TPTSRSAPPLRRARSSARSSIRFRSHAKEPGRDRLVCKGNVETYTTARFFEAQSGFLARQQRAHEFDLRHLADPRILPLRERDRDLVEQHDPGHDRPTGKVSGKRRVIRIDEESGLEKCSTHVAASSRLLCEKQAPSLISRSTAATLRRDRGRRRTGPAASLAAA